MKCSASVRSRVITSWWRSASALPRSLPAAIAALENSQPTRAILGEAMVALFAALKRHEHEERQALTDPRQDWDLTHLIEFS